MSRKPYDLPVEEGPGEGLDDPWWEDALVDDPEPEPEPETPAGFSEEWEEEPVEEESPDWGPDDESVEGFDDPADWDPLVEAEEMQEPAEVFEEPRAPHSPPGPPAKREPDEDSDEDTEDEEGDEETHEDAAEEAEEEVDKPTPEPWTHQVVSWAPSVRVNGRPVAATCATDRAQTLIGPELAGVGEPLERVVRVEIEGREVQVTARVAAEAHGCVVLGRDALAQARLLVDPAQN